MTVRRRRAFRRPFRGALAAVAACALAAATAQEPVAVADLPPNALIPDLRVLPPSDLHLVGDDAAGGALRLKFATVIWNAGEGPIEVHGPAPEGDDGDGGGGAPPGAAAGAAEGDAEHGHGPDDALPDRTAGRTADRPETDSFVARQVVHDADGGRHDLGEVGVLNYEHRHGHLHLASFARYELWSLEADEPVALVAENDKIGFCLMDNLMVDEELAARDDPWYFACDQSVQGISPGWGDLYVAELLEQDLVLTGVPDGRYRLVNVADPDDALFGADPAVAWASVDLVLEGTTVRAVEGSERVGSDAARR